MDELRHLQLVVLGIATDIDSLCRENNINYYLGGGGAIGAVRHHGFIPWDDDLDFLMPYEDYEKFVAVCKEKLDQAKYEIDRDVSPWALPCLKIRLKGTRVEEGAMSRSGDGCQGIFLDVFRLEHSPESALSRRLQYYASKLMIAYNCRRSGYMTSDKKKKTAIRVSSIMEVPLVRSMVKKAVFGWNNKEAKTLGCLWGTVRLHNAFTGCDVYGKAVYLPFEDTRLALPEHYHEYLTQFFGNYMQLPPVEKRVAPHIAKIDFGNY